jgi:DNA ligase (NAD+)
VPVNRMVACDGLDEVLEQIRQWQGEKATWEYEVDGAVVKVDEIELRGRLGATSKYPRWCIAYKYEAERAETVLRSADFQVGRLGTITPVAHFDAVQLSGTTVSSASLHNFDQVERLGVRVGDAILVEKAGEIIPQVVQVVHEKRPKGARRIAPPKKCPSCRGETVRDEGGVYLRCINPECPAQIRERLRFFAGRNQMNIDGLGEAVISSLVDKGLVEHFADLYALKAEDLVGLPRTDKLSSRGNPITFKDKSAADLVEAIGRSKSRALERVLASVGIPSIGSYWAEVFAREYGDIERLLSASQGEIRGLFEKQYPQVPKKIHEYLQSESGSAALGPLADMQATPRRLQVIPEVGPKRASQLTKRFDKVGDLLRASRDAICDALQIEKPDWRIADRLYTFLHSQTGHGVLERLRQAGVKMTAEHPAPSAAEAEAAPLDGKTVVVTGTLEGFSREEAEDAIKASGGRPTSSVSKNTDFVVVGEGPGSKADKAPKLGVETIDEAEFLRRLGRGREAAGAGWGRREGAHGGAPAATRAGMRGLAGGTSQAHKKARGCGPEGRSAAARLSTGPRSRGR